MARFNISQLKRYSLELYGPGGAEDLIWKVDSDDPFAPMAVGERLLPLDLPDAHPDKVYEITGVEHVIWTAGEQLRYVTRVYTRPAEPLG